MESGKVNIILSLLILFRFSCLPFGEHFGVVLRIILTSLSNAAVCLKVVCLKWGEKYAQVQIHICVTEVEHLGAKLASR